MAGGLLPLIGADQYGNGTALHDEQARALVGAADVVIALTSEAYTRRSGGRWAAQDTPAMTTGDEAIARAVIEAVAVRP